MVSSNSLLCSELFCVFRVVSLQEYLDYATSWYAMCSLQWTTHDKLWLEHLEQNSHYIYIILDFFCFHLIDFNFLNIINANCLEFFIFLLDRHGNLQFNENTILSFSHTLCAPVCTFVNTILFDFFSSIAN